MIIYKLVNNEFQLNDCYYIRNQVFVLEQGISKDIEFDNEDKKALHFIVYDDLNPIGTLRVLINDSKAHIGRVAILKEYRGQHIGSNLLLNVESYLKESGIKQIYLNAQLSALNFYTNLGFITSGNIFLEANIEHIKMIKDI